MYMDLDFNYNECSMELFWFQYLLDIYKVVNTGIYSNLYFVMSLGSGCDNPDLIASKLMDQNRGRSGYVSVMLKYLCIIYCQNLFALCIH